MIEVKTKSTRFEYIWAKFYPGTKSEWRPPRIIHRVKLIFPRSMGDVVDYNSLEKCLGCSHCQLRKKAFNFYFKDGPKEVGLITIRPNRVNIDCVLEGLEPDELEYPTPCMDKLWKPQNFNLVIRQTLIPDIIVAKGHDK